MTASSEHLTDSNLRTLWAYVELVGGGVQASGASRNEAANQLVFWYLIGMKKTEWRILLVRYVRRGGSLREAARRFDCSVSTAWNWVQRARGQRLDRVDWQDLPSGLPRPVNRTAARIERRIIRQRRWLARHDALGYIGPLAVRQGPKKRTENGVGLGYLLLMRSGR